MLFRSILLTVDGDMFDGQEDDGHKDIVDDTIGGPKKYYVDGGTVEIAANVVWDLDADGKRLRMVKLTEYAGDAHSDDADQSFRSDADQIGAKRRRPLSV